MIILAIYIYLIENSVMKFSYTIFTVFSLSSSCCSNYDQQGTRLCQMRSPLIMLDRWFDFQESPNSRVRCSLDKLDNQYLENHQQPLW